MDGFAIFHQIVTTQEAVVPLETRNASSYLLAFDNTKGGAGRGGGERFGAERVIPVSSFATRLGSHDWRPGTSL